MNKLVRFACRHIGNVWVAIGFFWALVVVLAYLLCVHSVDPRACLLAATVATIIFYLIHNRI